MIPQAVASLESSIMLLELSITLLESIYSTVITHDDHHMMLIVQATERFSTFEPIQQNFLEYIYWLSLFIKLGRFKRENLNLRLS